MAKVLIGFMGSGKSTVARLLDDQFIDMDAVIEERLGMTIADFFKEEGEAAFRRIEQEVLRDLLNQDHLVSTGGGVVISPANRILLQEAENVIYLKASFETLYARIAADTVNRRPLFEQESKEGLQVIFDQRQPWYEACASQIVSVDGKTPQEIIEEIV